MSEHARTEHPPMELPRCFWHGQRNDFERCKNDAVFAIVKPVTAEDGTPGFWYYPVCTDCHGDAGESVGSHILAHAYTSHDNDA